MAITNLPTFEDDEILAAGKLNELRDAIENKFTGGVSAADIAFPFVANGNIDMDGNLILGLQRFWNVFNAAEYDTLQEAIDAAEAAGGGAVFVPPNTTLSADGLTLTSGDVMIFGAGASSVIATSAAASAGYLLRTNAGLSNIWLANLKLDGSGNAAAGQAGLYFQNATNVNLHNLIFDDFTGDHLVLRNDGTAGNSCEDVRVVNCRFLNGDAGHVFMDDVDGAIFHGCHFDSPTTDAIEGVPSGAAAAMRSVIISNCQMRSGARGVYVVGGSATANDLWRLIQIDGCQLTSQSGNAVTVGATTAIVKFPMITGNIIVSAGADAIAALASGGRIAGNYAPSAVGDGLDATSSDDLVIADNDFPDAGAVGIDATSTTNCRVRNNDVHGASTEGITRDSAVGLDCQNNYGDACPPATQGWYKGSQTKHTGSVAETTVWTQTIPANTIPNAGEGFRVFAAGDHSGTGSATIRLKLGGTTIASLAGISVEGWLLDVMVFNTASNAQAVIRLGVNDPLDNTDAVAVPTSAIDMTADADITVTVENDAAGGDSGITFGTIQLTNLRG